MLVRHKKALAGYLGGIILTVALIGGISNINNIKIVITSLIGIIIAVYAAWFTFRK